MQPTVVFGRIRGIPVGAHWTALAGVGLLAVLIATTVLPLLAPGRDPAVYATAGAATATAFVLSVLAHEIAHALVALRCGLQVRRITPWLLGGISELGGTPGPSVEMRVAAAGPLVSLGLGALCVGLTAVGGVAGRVAALGYDQVARARPSCGTHRGAARPGKRAREHPDSKSRTDQAGAHDPMGPMEVSGTGGRVARWTPTWIRLVEGTNDPVTHTVGVEDWSRVGGSDAIHRSCGRGAAAGGSAAASAR